VQPRAAAQKKSMARAAAIGMLSLAALGLLSLVYVRRHRS